jgi:NADPH:quinone reductase-like Zn-dependent oxidoreductase
MKAAIYIRRSSGKYLEVVDIAPPVPRKGEVLIKMYAASVNPLDWRLKSHYHRKFFSIEELNQCWYQ